MSSHTVTDLSAKEWADLKSTTKSQHNTAFDGDNSGTATTDTPGLGKTVVGYEYDPDKETAVFTVQESPSGVPDEVVWFALGATVAHVSGAEARSY